MPKKYSGRRWRADVIRVPVIPRSHRLEAPLLFRVALPPPGDSTLWARRAIGVHAIDWDRLIGLALLENAVTVLRDGLAFLPVSDVPSDVRTRINSLALVWTLKLRLLETRLRDSVEALSDAGIDVMLLKGAALAVTAYPSFVDRPMADLDFLVDPARAVEAHRLMQTVGWIAEPTGYSVEVWDEHHHLPPLADSRGSGLRLEIHAAPLAPGHPFRLDRALLLASAATVSVGRAQVHVPEPHLHALHAAIHFAWSHSLDSGALNAFRDLAVLSSAQSFSWTRLTALARDTGSEASLYWTLRLARSLSGLAVPAELLARLSPPLGERTLSMLEHHFTEIICRTERGCPSVALRQRLWSLALGTEHLPRDEFRSFDRPAASTRVTPTIAILRRAAAHIGRVPRWSRYFAGLLGSAFEVRA
jgi:hypothetical protein